MRILLVNAFYPPRTTGSAHFSRDVARRFSLSGHDVTVLTTAVAGAALDEELDGVRVVRLAARECNARRLSFNYSLPFVARHGAVREVTELMRATAPDIVFQNGQFFDLTFATTWAAQRLGIPRVLTVHTPLVHNGPVLRRFIAAVERTLLRAANAPGRPQIVGVDRSVCELVERRYRPRRPVRFIPATLEIDAFGGGDGERVRAVHALRERPIILSLGHVIPTRSRLPLIRALPAILERHPDAVVLVVGGVYDRRFLRLAERLGVAASVRAVGPVPHDEVADHLAAATVDCHDLDGRTLGITTMEVMASGVPMFAIVRRDVFPGIDLDRWPALQLVESATPHEIARALCRMIASPSLRADIAGEQRRFVEQHFAAEDVAARYLALFDEIVSGETVSAAVPGSSAGRATRVGT
jgi:glycosyltransferase involved in cell wall biosynthesis